MKILYFIYHCKLISSLNAKNHIYTYIFVNISAPNLSIANKTIFYAINESRIKIISSTDKNCIKNATDGALFLQNSSRVVLCSLAREVGRVERIRKLPHNRGVSR